MTNNTTYGVLLRKKYIYAADQKLVVEASVVYRENHDRHFPSPIFRNYPHAYVGLVMQGYINQFGDFVDWFPAYDVKTKIDRYNLHIMHETILEITNKFYKTPNANIKPTVGLTAFCEALGLTFVVEHIGSFQHAVDDKSQWHTTDWKWYSVEDGAKRYTRLIKEARNDHYNRMKMLAQHEIERADKGLGIKT